MKSGAAPITQGQEDGPHQEAHEPLPPADEHTTLVTPRSPGSTRWKFLRVSSGVREGWWEGPAGREDEFNKFGFKLTDEREAELQGVDVLFIVVDQTNVAQTTTELHLLDVIKDATHLSLRGIAGELGTEMLRKLAEFLKLAHNRVPLEALVVARGRKGNDMTWAETIRCIFAALESGSLMGLTSLTIESFDLTDAHMQSLGRAIGAGLCPSFSEISFRHTGLSLEGLKCLAACLRGVSKLRRLNLTGNRDCGSAHVALASAMASGQLVALKTLDLRGTGMEDDGCVEYAKFMSSQELPALKRIDFRKNDIGKKGASALADAVRSGNVSGLEYIDLSNNRDIGDDGVGELCQSLEPKEPSTLSAVPNLRYLGLMWIGLSERGFLSVSDTLAVGHLNSLEYLFLQGNLDSEKSAQALVAALVSNNALKVYIDYEWFMYPEIDRFRAQMLERNRKIADLVPDLGEWVPATMGKVYLCGNPEVGKTTLRKSLQRGVLKALCMHERGSRVEERTRGIEVSQFMSKGKRGQKPMRLMMWDMAGQDEYHLVHHAFFPDLSLAEGKGTMFVVVCDKLEKEGAREDLQYWLGFIASGCGRDLRSPVHVLLVLNVKQGNIFSVPGTNWWEGLVQELKDQFKRYIVVEETLLSTDVRKRRFVRPIHRCIVHLCRENLMNEKTPKICDLIQRNLSIWSREKQQFPVMDWQEFDKKFWEWVVNIFTEKNMECVNLLPRHPSNFPKRNMKCVSLLPRHKNPNASKITRKMFEAAVKYLNEAGVLIFINTSFPSEWNVGNRKLVVMDPNWLVRDVAGALFLPQSLTIGRQVPFRKKVDGATGSISISTFKECFGGGKQGEWVGSEDVDDLLVILLWLGLCYIGRENKVFFPALIVDDGSSSIFWKPSDEYADSQWVMGYSVEREQGDVLAPISLWHRFQVELAQTTKYKARVDQSFTVGKLFVTFVVDDMVVLIEVNATEERPTFERVDIFVKPLRKLSQDHNQSGRKECQVDLARELVEILLKLWGEICGGLGYVERCIWPRRASNPKEVSKVAKNLEVKEVKELVEREWLEDQGVGRTMLWKVGTEEILTQQLLSKKDIQSVIESVKGKVVVVGHGFSSMKDSLEEAVELGIFSRDVLDKVGLNEAFTSQVNEISPSRQQMSHSVEELHAQDVPISFNTNVGASSEIELASASDFLEIHESSVRQPENLLAINRFHDYLEKRFGSLGKGVMNIQGDLKDIKGDLKDIKGDLKDIKGDLQDVLRFQKTVLQKAQRIETILLGDLESTCPRFIYLGAKSSSKWVSWKKALPLQSVHVYFLCEAKHGDFKPHVVKEQKGLEVMGLTDLGEKILPWLKVSLTVLFITTKIAADVVAPGLGIVIPSELPFLREGSTLCNSLASMTGLSQEELGKREGILQKGKEIQSDASVGSKPTHELYGSSRKAMTDLLGNLTDRDYEYKVGLRKVFLKRPNGDPHGISWICSDCYDAHRRQGLVNDR